MLNSLAKDLDLVLESKHVHWLDTALVYVNALLIAYANSSLAEISHKDFIHQFLYVFLGIFIVEIGIRLLIHKKSFFSDHRNIFSAFVLTLSVVLWTPDLTILLALRSLRALRTVEFIPKTRHLIDALYHALPGVLNIIILIIAVYAMFAILGVHFFGEKVPELWGSFSDSAITLQQIMVSDNWGENLRTTMKFYPYAWIFFDLFLILTAFILLNLFIAIIVDAMQAAEKATDQAESTDNFEALVKKNIKKTEEDLQNIEKKLDSLQSTLKKHFKLS